MTSPYAAAIRRFIAISCPEGDLEGTAAMLAVDSLEEAAKQALRERDDYMQTGHQHAVLAVERYDMWVAAVDRAEAAESRLRTAETDCAYAEEFAGNLTRANVDLRTKLRTAETALRLCASSAGMPDAGDGCRAVIKIVKGTLEQVTA